MNHSLLRNLPLVVAGCAALSSCGVIRDIGAGLTELCNHDTYVVVNEEVGNDPRTLCNRTSGECQSLREAINTAQLCAASAPKTVQLVPGGTYTITNIDTPAPITISRVRSIKRQAGHSGLPPVYGEIRIIGDNTVIERDTESAEGFRLLMVTREGQLTLESLILRNGYPTIDPGNDDPTLDWYSGGAIYNLGTVNVEGVTFQNNRTVAWSPDGSSQFAMGGAIYSLGTFRINQSLFTDNFSEHVNDIHNGNDATATVRDSTFTATMAAPPEYSESYQIYNSNHAFIELIDSTFTTIGGIIGNAGAESHMVIDGSSAFDITGSPDTTFILNAGSHSGSVLEIKRSTFSNIRSFRNVIATWDESTTLLQDVTLFGNSLAADDSNAAALSASLRPDGLPRVEISNSVIAENTPANCRFSRPASPSVVRETSIDSDGTCGFGLTESSMQLGPLTDNGGPTLTHMPNVGSPVIDAGGTSCLSHDQIGRTRPRDLDSDGVAECDIGSVELPLPEIDLPFDPIDPIDPVIP